MPSQNVERAIGSIVIGVIAGAFTSWVLAAYLTMYGLFSGRINLIEYPEVQPHPWHPWEIWTIAISIAVGVATTIFVSRSLFKWSGSKQVGPWQKSR